MSTILKFFRIGDGHLSIFNKYDFVNVKKKLIMFKKKQITKLSYQ